MATTTNYGWVTPDDTDLVKDGAAAIRTLGTSIDTSFVDLLGGTTGQVLTKASGTDLDFTFATPAGFPAATTYTPIVTSTGGTATSVTATGNHSQLGKFVILNLDVTVTNAGTATGAIICSLPIASKSGILGAVGSGQEVVATGAQAQLVLFPSVNAGVQMRKFDFTTFWTTSLRVIGTIIYEVA